MKKERITLKIEITSRAKEKGIQQLEMLEYIETEKYFVGVVHEKRMREREIIDFVDPIVIFKTEIKSGDYDRARKFVENAGVLLILPETNNFKTAYYDMTFNGYTRLIKSWGYSSNHLPPSKRWDNRKIKRNAEAWLPDTILIAEIIQFALDLMDEGLNEIEIIANIKDKYRSSSI